MAVMSFATSFLMLRDLLFFVDLEFMLDQEKFVNEFQKNPLLIIFLNFLKLLIDSNDFVVEIQRLAGVIKVWKYENFLKFFIFFELSYIIILGKYDCQQ